MTQKDFISYLRLVYTNYELSSLGSKDDLAGMLHVAITYDDHKLTKIISFDNNLYNPDNIGHLHKIALENALEQIESESMTYIYTHFDKVVRSPHVKHWYPTLINKFLDILQGDFKNWCHFSTWLDVLWFSHSTESAQLKATAVAKLHDLINVENVFLVLVAAHVTGEKQLRSTCIDFLVTHGAYVEDFQRMRAGADIDVSLVGKLSVSIRDEVTKKVRERVSTLRLDTRVSQPKSKVTLFNRKKRTCELCKRVVEPEDLKKDLLLPDVFGLNGNRQVCRSCQSLITLIPK